MLTRINRSHLQEILRGNIAALKDAALANDEYIQTRSFAVPTVTQDTTLPTLCYVGDGGRYKLTFAVRIEGG